MKRAASVDLQGKEGPTLLVVADDPDVLLLAQAILSRKGHPVLIANSAQDAVQLLKLGHIHSLAIRADMTGWQDVRKWCMRRGVAPWFFCASVQSGAIQIKGMGPEAVASDLVGHDTSGNLLAAG